MASEPGPSTRRAGPGGRPPASQAASQASSHFPLEPVPASVLRDLEVHRRDALQQIGSCRTGCGEVDDEVLLGGFERGCVVGISAEGEHFGVTLALQTLACALTSASASQPQRAVVVTTQPASAVLPSLRDAFVAELSARGTARDHVASECRRQLENVAVSRIFDLEGLWEVLGEMTVSADNSRSSEAPDRSEVPGPPQPRADAPPPEPAAAAASLRSAGLEGKAARTEIADSEDEDDDLSPISSSPGHKLPEAPTETSAPPTEEKPIPPASTQSTQSAAALPNIILITDFSSLMTGLFTHRDKTAAHSALQLLSSHLRHLSRTLPSCPLILLCNGTTSPDRGYGGRGGDADAARGAAPKRATPSSSTKPLDQTLRSIFNPPELAISGYGAAASAASRRNKPSFGLVFTQLLDLHLLCTRMPRSGQDAEQLFAPAPAPVPPGSPPPAARSPGGSSTGGGGAAEARLVWTVECLLDEMGVWEGKTGERRSREQRWGAVDVRGGRIVNAFEARAKEHGPVKVAGGFGGLRV